jgi:hypothetical protein
VKENALEKKRSLSLSEKTQYSLTFGVITVMLFYAGFPIFLLLFLGVLGFFLWKIFSIEAKSETRQIFEFYLSANEILREDDRRWYGFEIQETIQRGEHIIRAMTAAPPLAYFALGALYQKLEDHASAVRHLSRVAGESASPESAIVFPTRELREYVRMLRKIERTPAEAPLTSSAIRALERARKHKAKQLLEHSRSQLSSDTQQLGQGEQTAEPVADLTRYRGTNEPEMTQIDYADKTAPETAATKQPFTFTNSLDHKNGKPGTTDNSHSERKSISEVLHDIYDENIQ